MPVFFFVRMIPSGVATTDPTSQLPPVFRIFPRHPNRLEMLPHNVSSLTSLSFSYQAVHTQHFSLYVPHIHPFYMFTQTISASPLLNFVTELSQHFFLI